MWRVNKVMNKLVLLLLSGLILSCTVTKEPEELIVEQIDGRPDKKRIPMDLTGVPDAIPQYEPWSPSINPVSYTVLGKDYKVLKTNKGYKQQGIASWYGTKFHEKKTATGEDYDMFAMTAAHKTLPIPSYVRVTNLDNQTSIIVKINDRGPFHDHRIIDLSYIAAIKLGIEQAGTGFVEVTAVHPGEEGISRGVINSKRVYIQIGAFGEQANAAKLQQRLASEISLTASRIKKQESSDSVLYRVQVGPISSVVEADAIRQKLNSIAITRTQFISE